MSSKNYDKKSRIFTEHIGVRVEPEVKQMIEELKPHKEVADIIRDGIREKIKAIHSEVFSSKRGA